MGDGQPGQDGQRQHRPDEFTENDAVEELMVQGK